MKKKVRHVLGISGGKDSAALAIYPKDKYPHLDMEYYYCDTGKELEATYKLIENLEIYLGKKIHYRDDIFLKDVIPVHPTKAPVKIQLQLSLLCIH